MLTCRQVKDLLAWVMALKSKRPWFLFFSIILIAIVIGITLVTTKKIASVDSCSSADLSGVIDENEKLAIFEGRQIPVPQIAYNNRPTEPVLGVSAAERWVEVDLSEQKLRAWEGNTLYLETLISTGLPWWPTPEGEFRIQYKVRATKMEGGEGRYYYNLPNVPFVMFFGNEKLSWGRGYGLHGAYWHNEFGTRRSHGCVNLPIPMAEQIYNWSGPVVPEGKYWVKADATNIGTRIVIHE